MLVRVDRIYYIDNIYNCSVQESRQLWSHIQRYPSINLMKFVMYFYSSICNKQRQGSLKKNFSCIAFPLWIFFWCKICSKYNCANILTYFTKSKVKVVFRALNRRMTLLCICIYQSYFLRYHAKSTKLEFSNLQNFYFFSNMLNDERKCTEPVVTLAPL